MPESIELPTNGSFPGPVLRVLEPQEASAPVVVASPHSGRCYPQEFVAASRLSANDLRRSEDSFVEELFADATGLGIPLLQAEFPRAFCDANREAWELDPVMFADTLPPWCNTASARVSAGFGTLARLVASGEPIYRDKLLFAEAEWRVRTCWQPYHAALGTLIERTVGAHGACLLIDAHSMPSGASPARGLGADFVLGDAFGTSCAPALTQTVERFLRARGFRVRRNDPYAGGYVTRHYGRPSRGVHALQIEVCRSLYMNEGRLERLPRFGEISGLLGGLLEVLVDAVPGRRD